MKRLILTLFLLIIPIGGYLWFRQTPEQQVLRAVDQFLENVEHRKISTRRTIDVHEALTEVLAPEINFQGNWPIPTDKLSLEETIGQIDQLHSFTSLCEMTEIERSVKIIGSKAQVYQTTKILVAAGKNHKEEQVWDLIIDLEKGDDWRITGLRGSRP